MAIDRTKAVEELSKIQVQGNQEGLIPGFGVLVQQLPASFWNGFSNKILAEAGESLHEDAAGLLENAAGECGYHTGYGIITSNEFQAVCGPMIEESTAAEDTLHGAYAVLTAWGWADAEIVELIPGERMVIRAKSYYEQDGAAGLPGRHPFAHMVTGVSRAFMDLAYGDKPYPDGHGKFVCKQTKGIELGDPYGEFVVTRADAQPAS